VTAPASALDALREVVGERHLVTDRDLMGSHTVDWTGRWHGDADAVVRPADTEQVRGVVEAARAHQLSLVPQGGNTGLVGGATPQGGGIVVDLRRLDGLEPVDVAAAQVTVGAGVTLTKLQRHAGHSGLAFPVDLGARDTATIGGMVATNAGGMHVLRYGGMRAQVLGLEAVLGRGDVVRANLAGLLKDNTGYDLAGLLCGSEGTLGIVTRARLRLVPLLPQTVVALLGFGSIADAVDALPVLRGRPALNAVEVMLADGVDVVSRHLGVPFPLAPVPPCVLLVELAADDPLPDLATILQALELDDQATAVADDPRAAARLWRWREAHPEAAAAHGLVHKADVTVPLVAMGAFVEEVVPALQRRAPGALVLVYGHLADGNLHVNIVGPASDDEGPLDCVFDLVLRLGGSVSAEHGIGIAKRGWLVRQRGDTAVAAMTKIKQALDPDGILNPGVLLP
jgi:FAD/FMN-containing dehydrogenase